MGQELASIDISEEQKKLIKDTVCQNATDAEMQLFFHDCKRRGIHPLDRKLYFSVRKDKSGARKYTPLVSIDFMRERADATNDLMGIGEPIFEGQPKKPDFLAKVTVKRFRHGQVIDFVGVARWSEFYPGDSLGFMWGKMPHNQLAKCAEAQAHRKAFSAAMAGIYLHEEFEMDREPSKYISVWTETYAPDIWIDGIYHGFKEGIGPAPGRMMIEYPDMVGPQGFQVVGKPEGWDDNFKKGELIRFQFTKAGKFRPVSIIERRTIDGDTVSEQPVPALGHKEVLPKAGNDQEAQNTPKEESIESEESFAGTLKAYGQKSGVGKNSKPWTRHSIEIMTDEGTIMATSTFSLSVLAGCEWWTPDLLEQGAEEQWPVSFTVKRDGQYTNLISLFRE